MRLIKNPHYDPNFTSGWVLKSFPFKVLYENTKLPIYNIESRTYTDEYLKISNKIFGEGFNEKPILSLRNLPKNKIRLYFRSKEEFEKFKEIILILKITH